MRIAIPVFPRLTALDAIGPYEVLQRVPSLDIVFVGAERGLVRTDNGFLGLAADATFDEVPRPDVVLVPGGIGTRDHLGGSDLVDWVRGAHATTRYTTSVCTGSLILGAAGLLDGLTATTYWSVSSCWKALAPRQRSSGWWSISTAGSSRPPACRRASTWPSGSWNFWSTRSVPRRHN